ncbi:MAG: NUDIX hydrolase, partial [Candidatus Woesearchaeota archaeon]
MITPATFFRDNTECFLVHNEKVLALKTDYGFIFPGGGVKSGETPIDAVKREILEETSLKISHAGFLESAYFVWPKDHIKTEKQKL